MATSHESVKCICSDKKVVEVDPKTWKSKCGTFQCLKDILDVLKSDTFFEGVDVMSFSSLKLIAKHVSTKSQALQLVCVFADRLKFLLDPKRRSLVEKMIEKIADGFEVNKCFDQDEMFEFIYELLDNGVNNRSVFPGDNATMISGFALEVLHKRTEKGEVNLELIDPFLPLVMGCLSKQPIILSSALRGLKSLLRFPLPSLREYFQALGKKEMTSSLSLVATLYMVAAHLCFVLKEHTSNVLERDLTENMVYVLSALHSRIGQLDQATCSELWLSLGENEKEMFRKAFKVLDREKEGASSTDFLSGNERDIRKELIGNLLKRMGELALEKESVEMRVVFSVYKEFSKEEGCHLYAWEVMFPLCKVCEGFAGENISVELKELGENVRDSLSLANQIFGEVYGGIREGLQANVKKRAREELGKAA